MSKLDILFVFPNVPEPRNENIMNLVKNDYKVGAMFWKKNPEQAPYCLEGCQIYEVPIKANDHNPLARLLPTVKYYREALKILEKIQPKCIHVSKIDSMFLVWLYWKKAKNKPRIVYDISDLHTLAYNDATNPLKVLIRNMLWKMEKKVSSCVDYILVTSPKFYDEYYKDFYKKEQVIFVPNAPDVTCFEGFKKKTEGPYTIGFVGSVRYYHQMISLFDVAKEIGVNVFVAGSGVDEQRLREYAKDMPNVVFYGKYNYTKEIRHLYEQIDCVYALYDTSIKNVKVALPNKLYEGAFCGLPFIASKGVYVAEIIEEYGFGIAAEDWNKEDIKRVITAIQAMNKDSIAEGSKRFNEENSFKQLSCQMIYCYRELVNKYKE